MSSNFSMLEAAARVLRQVVIFFYSSISHTTQFCCCLFIIAAAAGIVNARARSVINCKHASSWGTQQTHAHTHTHGHWLRMKWFWFWLLSAIQSRRSRLLNATMNEASLCYDTNRSCTMTHVISKQTHRHPLDVPCAIIMRAKLRVFFFLSFLAYLLLGGAEWLGLQRDLALYTLMRPLSALIAYAVFWPVHETHKLPCTL